jgi:flagellar basal body-associated protein FliL
MSEMSATRKASLWVGLVFLLGAALGGVMGYGFAHRSVSAAPASQSSSRSADAGSSASCSTSKKKVWTIS